MRSPSCKFRTEHFPLSKNKMWRDDDDDDRARRIPPGAFEVEHGSEERGWPSPTTFEATQRGDLEELLARTAQLLQQAQQGQEGQQGQQRDDDGGWTRVYASLYPTWWSETDWSASGDPEDDDYSILSQISQFSDDDGAWTMRLVVGNADTWDTSDYDYATIWSQEHDPISDSSDGSDYTFIDGDEPTTCDGFTGLHSTYYDDGGTYALVSDPNDDDDTKCIIHINTNTRNRVTTFKTMYTS